MSEDLDYVLNREFERHRDVSATTTRPSWTLRLTRLMTKVEGLDTKLDDFVY